jgi:hypothetical protein
VGKARGAAVLAHLLDRDLSHPTRTVSMSYEEQITLQHAVEHRRRDLGPQPIWEGPGDGLRPIEGAPSLGVARKIRLDLLGVVRLLQPRMRQRFDQMPARP